MDERNPLLYTDFDGAPVADPDAVISGGLYDPRHRTRVPGLVQLLDDPAADPFERLLACLALTSWAEHAGYRTVIEAAANPRATPWYGYSTHRLWPVDDSFGLLASAVESSTEMSNGKNSGQPRRSAIRALLSVADSEYFASTLDFLVQSIDAQDVVEDVARAVRRGVDAQSDGVRVGFPLGEQLIDAAAALTWEFEERVVDLVMDVLQVDGSPGAMVHAAAVVARGRGEASRSLGEYLAMAGDERVREYLAGRGSR